MDAKISFDSATDQALAAKGEYERLSRLRRRIVLQYFGSGHTGRETADYFGISIYIVWELIRRGREDAKWQRTAN